MVLNLKISRKPRCEQYFELATSQPYIGMSHHWLPLCLELKGMSINLENHFNGVNEAILYLGVISSSYQCSLNLKTNFVA
jgi:hypothetical protein